MKKIFFYLTFAFISFHSFGQIIANDDTIGVLYNTSVYTSAENILNNDTLNGVPVSLSTVTLTQLSTTNPGISISNGSIVVAAGTTRGTYTLTYEICSITNSTLCATATITVNTKLVANPDYFIGSCPGSYLGNVLGYGNFVDTLNGAPAILQTYYTQPGNVEHPADVSLTILESYPFFGVDTASGDVYLNFPVMGQYTITYQLCEIAHPNNCSIGYITIDIIPGFLDAVDDDFTNNPVNNATGGGAGNVLFNDYSQCDGFLNMNNATVTGLSAPSGIMVYPDGSVTVNPGIAPGIYTMSYMVCSLVDNFNCDTASALVSVSGISDLIANYDDFSGPFYANTTTASVLDNDTSNNMPVNPAEIVLTPLNIPMGFSFNADGTINIGANVPEGTYTVPYMICSIVNPTICYANYAYVVVLKNRFVGKVKFDNENNGCDSNDSYINNISVQNVNGSNTYTSLTRYYDNDSYYLIGDQGTNTVSITGLPSYFTVTPSNQVFNLSAPGTIFAPDFCITANANVDDLEIILIPLFNVVPGLPAYYNICYKNNGSTTLNGQITFQFPNSKMSFSSSSPSPNSTAPSMLTYNFSSLAPFESRLIRNVRFDVLTPPTVEAGNIVSFTGNITPNTNDNIPFDNTSSIYQVVVNSQDPNDIVVHEGTSITLAQAQQEYLHYTIRFQNIGTSDAINIKIINDLDPKLDWSTFELISTSHNCRVKNKNNHNEFLFENINLPGVNFGLMSHGYITYKVKPIASIAVGDMIPNTANIYFDYNAPIQTNIATTTVVANLNSINHSLDQLSCFPNPVKNNLLISNSANIDTIEITSVLGQQMLSQKVNSLQTEINLSHLTNGIYFVKITSEGVEKTVKIVKE